VPPIQSIAVGHQFIVMIEFRVLFVMCFDDMMHVILYTFMLTDVVLALIVAIINTFPFLFRTFAIIYEVIHVTVHSNDLYRNDEVWGVPWHLEMYHLF